VEHLEGSLITRHAQPLLKLEGAQSGGTMCHKICAPKPGGYGNLAAVDDSVRGQAYVTLTGSAPDNLGSIAKAEGLASDTATRAVEAVGKAMRIQIVEAGSLVGEEALEVREGLRRRQVGRNNGWVSGMATWHMHRVRRVTVGGNRIGMVRTMPIRMLPNTLYVVLAYLQFYVVNTRGSGLGR
jgi:hypothetical protein